MRRQRDSLYRPRDDSNRPAWKKAFNPAGWHSNK
jgi:hypothetical protein